MTRLNKNFTENKKSYLLYLLVYVSALIIGTVCSAFCPQEAMNGAGELLKGYFRKSAALEIRPVSIFAASAKYRAGELIFLILTGITRLGGAAAYSFFGFKGFFAGYTIGIILRTYALSGLLLSIICLAAPAILLLPAYCAVAGFCAPQRVNDRAAKDRAFTRRLVSAAAYSIPAILLLGLGVMAETFLVPALMSCFAFLFV